MQQVAPNGYREAYSGDSESGLLRVAFQGAGRPLVARQSFPLPLRRKHKQVWPLRHVTLASTTPRVSILVNLLVSTA